MNPQLTFVTRLRRERQRAGITLEEIASRTRVKPELLEAFENNDLTDWPRGLYARAWVRGYAEVVGLDPADTVDEFCRLYLHGDRRSRSTIREMAALTATESEYRDEFGHEERRRGERRKPVSSWGILVETVRRGLRARMNAIASLFAKPGNAAHRSH